MQTLQEDYCTALEAFESEARFTRDPWQRAEGGGGLTRVLSGGQVFEKGGVNFSHVHGTHLPPAATKARPELAGRNFEAVGVSLIMHPHNPFVPTTHFNLRFFWSETEGETPVWWFGGGFDLTPYYGFEEDCQHWHREAKAACDPFGKELYPKFKAWADQYFYLTHREEARGIGGLFFDDFNMLGFEKSFAFFQSIGSHFLPAYLPIVEKRKLTPFTQQQRDFQLYRRGRYVEFNLLYDRGTLFGLQSKGRTESILVSLPPLVNWTYQYTPLPNSPEEALTAYYLKPKAWVDCEENCGS